MRAARIRAERRSGESGSVWFSGHWWSIYELEPAPGYAGALALEDSRTDALLAANETNGLRIDHDTNRHGGNYWPGEFELWRAVAAIQSTFTAD